MSVLLQTPPGRRPDVPAESLRIMCDALERLGRAHAPLLRECGINPDIIDAPGARVAAEREFAFQHLFMHASADVPGAWLDTGQHYRLMSFGEFGLAMLAASTMREAVQFAIEHVALAFTQSRFAWVRQAPPAHSGLAILNDGVDADMVEFSLERDLGAIRAMIDDMWQGQFPLAAIELTLSGQGRRDNFERVLQAPVTFGAAHNVLYFPDWVLDEPLPLGDPLLGSTYARRCGQRLRVDADTPQALRDAVLDMLGAARAAWPDIATVATRLGLSERSLRRALRQAGTSFRQLQQRVRLQRAREMLQTNELAVERIAEELGYAEAASFSHAFRRWTGQSPRAFRRRQRDRPAAD